MIQFCNIIKLNPLSKEQFDFGALSRLAVKNSI